MALFVLIGGIVYFNLNVFAPRLIPIYLRLGMPTHPVNILVMGTDLVYDKETHRKLSEGGRTDTLILVHINPLGGKVSL